MVPMAPTAPTLLILAAGMGSRYGGLKQFDPMGPHGETLLDYSIVDALRAGFGRVVFVIRQDFSAAFKASIGMRYADRISVDYVYQDLLDVPDGFVVSPARTRPWGTLHAVLAARKTVDGPFAVINADDFYGFDAYRQVVRYFRDAIATTGGGHYCMVGYPIGHTLSTSGGVNRGICRETEGFLTGVEEHTGIVSGVDGRCRGFNLNGDCVEFSGDALASMNFWGFTPDIFGRMERYFADFLHACGRETDAECYIPSAVDYLIRTGETDCRILKTDASWFGVTYPQDKPASMANIRRLITAGEYATRLWA